jgi:uncharacterized membrane protein YccC
MTRKTLLTASLALPLIAMSGVAFAGPQWNPNMLPWNSAQALNQTSQPVVSKPYAQYLAAQTKIHWTGPKHNQYHVQRQ